MRNRAFAAPVSKGAFPLLVWSCGLVRYTKKGDRMGLTYVMATVTGPAGKSARVKFLVDSGAEYTLLPFAFWKAIKLVPKRAATFTLSDGTTIDRQISECHIALSLGDGHTPVILGIAGDEALLGVVTLEELGLVLNPFNRTLQPARLMLPYLLKAYRSHQSSIATLNRTGPQH